MRHQISGKRLGRNTGHRKCMLGFMAKSLIEHEKIITTTPKAKFIKPFIERLITKGKNGGLSNRRALFAVLRSDTHVNKLLTELSQRYANRQGGYIRILKCGYRIGDGAELSMLQLMDSK